MLKTNLETAKGLLPKELLYVLRVYNTTSRTLYESLHFL